MKNEYVARTLSVQAIESLPFDQNTDKVVLANPANIALLFKHMTIPFDVGCWLYTDRLQVDDRSKQNDRATPVLVNSFRKTRVRPVLTMLESLYFSVRAGKFREKTLHTNLKMLGYYIDWCDSSGNHDALDSLELAKSSLQVYIDHLSQRRRSGDLKQNSAAAMQNAVLGMLSKMFEKNIDEVSSGIRLLSLNSKATVPTPVPRQDDVSLVVSFCKDIFNGLADFAISQGMYPFQLELHREKNWVFPTQKWLATSEQLARRSAWKRGFWAWNYHEGRLNTFEEIAHHFDKRHKIKIAKLSTRAASKLLDEANEDPRHAARLNLAMWAHDAFTVLFFANTGMNAASIETLTWSDEFEIQKGHQGFRTVKYRARGALVEFHIAEQFLRPFKKFLVLRRFILNGQSFDRLFISLNDSEESFKPVQSRIVDYFTLKVKRKLDIELPAISARQWRAFKADYLIQNTDVSTTAMLLQNSEITALRSYSEGSESEVGQDFSKYFHQLQSRIFESTETVRAPSAVGHCSAPGKPTKERSNTPVESDCRQPEGCLFCVHHGVHADEGDIRKLASLAYVIRATRELAASDAHFEDTFGEVLRRIRALLDAVAHRSDALKRLVSIVERDVDENENLDTYWESKLSNLIEIGAIN